MKITVKKLEAADLSKFKRDMQDAFQKGAVDAFGECDEVILPESHIDRSLAEATSIAYGAYADGELVGGAIVVIDEKAKRGDLHFLYVRVDVEGHGIGYELWKSIEKAHDEIDVWETTTPYFEKRNIHFYINKCGFSAVEFFCEGHHDENTAHTEPDDEHDPIGGEYFEGMFRFEKRIGRPRRKMR